MVKLLRSKTYKREVAFLLLLNLALLSWTDKTQALEILVLPSFAFVAMAFGMDWGSKQTEFTRSRYNAAPKD